LLAPVRQINNAHRETILKHAQSMQQSPTTTELCLLVDVDCVDLCGMVRHGNDNDSTMNIKAGAGAVGLQFDS
jgi:hypothetical protein